jgi:zinc transporter, ZIP family
MEQSLGMLAIAAALTALVAAIGPVLSLAVEPTDWGVGMADALAAGMMLGIAYPMMRAGLDGGAVIATLAGGAAVVVLLLLHIAFRLDDRARPTPTGALLAATLHSAPEGLALGVATAVDPRLGVAVALTLALHNVGEALVLSAHLSTLVAPRWRVLAAVASNIPQFVLALAGFALATAVPPLLPALLGVSAAALIYLALADLLPDGYRVAGRTALSVMVIAATSLVAFAVALP